MAIIHFSEVCVAPVSSLGSKRLQNIFTALIDYKISHLCLQARRHAEFMALKKQILLHMEELDHIPETSFEKDVVCEDEDSFCLSRENITSLKLLICHVSLTFCPCHPAPVVVQKLRPEPECRIPAEASSLTGGVFLVPQLEERRAENEATCESLREKIQQLWDRLKMPQEEREAFNEHMVTSKKRNLEAVRRLQL